MGSSRLNRSKDRTSTRMKSSQRKQTHLHADPSSGEFTTLHTALQARRGRYKSWTEEWREQITPNTATNNNLSTTIAPAAAGLLPILFLLRQRRHSLQTLPTIE